MKLSVMAVTASLMASGCNSSSPAPGSPPDGGLGSLGDAAVLADANGTDAEIPESPDAGISCESSPVQEYVGEQSELYQGGGSQTENRVEVRWTLTSTVGCVDHYTPSGTIHDDDAGPCKPSFDPTFGEIEPGDGELIIDRSTSPATYTVRGESQYQSTMDGWDACDDSPTQTVTVGGQWADSSGSFDGKLIAGGLTSFPTRRWHLVASDALFTPPATGCSEPAQERWTSTHRLDGAGATITWTRVETTGCVDRYTPSGTATVTTDPSDPCTYADTTHSIAVEDSSLDVNRSSDPPTLVQGRFGSGITTWFTERRCPGQEPVEQFMVSTWGNRHLGHAFDGTRWSGQYETWGWSFARGD